MNEFLNNVKADLSDRRLAPIVLVVAVALLAALGYAAFGAGSSKPSASVEPSPVSPATGPLGVTPVQNTTAEALAETPAGVAAQRHGKAHDPFAPLPGSVQSPVTSSSSSSSSSSSTSSSSESSSSSSGSGSSGGTESNSKSSTPSKETKPSKPKVVYAASVLFGELPAGVTPANAQLTPYPSLTKPTALPNAKEKRLEFVGITLTKNGKGALFNLSGEVILHGPGICLPSSTQCEVLKVQAGKSEQLEYLPASGPAVTYELRVVNVHQVSATASAAAHIAKAQDRAARDLVAPWTGALRYSALHYAAGSGAFVLSHGAFGSAAN